MKGSDLEWVNLAAHKFELQPLIALRRINISNFFCILNFSPRGLIGLLTKLSKQFLNPRARFWTNFGVIGFGSNVPPSIAD